MEQQVITLTNVKQDLCHHMVSLGYNKLIQETTVCSIINSSFTLEIDLLSLAEPICGSNLDCVMGKLTQSAVISCWISVKIYLDKEPAVFIVVNTLRPRQKCHHFADDTCKGIFLNENVWILPTISLKFVPKSLINNIPALVHIMAWHQSGNKPLSEPVMANSLLHICVTQPQWAKHYCTINIITVFQIEYRIWFKSFNRNNNYMSLWINMDN